MKPIVSVVIPTKNRARYLSSATQSVLNQTFKDFELLIIDAASSDSTQKVVDSFTDKRIRYIREEIDRGASVSRNTGIKNSEGDFIAFLDDDDLWMPKKLEKQLRIMREHDSVDVVYTGVRIFSDEDGRTLGYKIPKAKGNIFPKILMDNLVGGCSTPLIKKECFDKVGLFDERLPSSEDFDLWIRLAKTCQFEYTKELLVLYRVHKDRISTSPDRKAKAQEILFRKYFKEIMKLPNRKKILANWYCSRGVTHFKCGKIEQGRREFIQGICNNPFNAFCYANLLISTFGQEKFMAIRRFLFSLLPAFVRFKIA